MLAMDALPDEDLRPSTCTLWYQLPTAAGPDEGPPCMSAQTVPWGPTHLPDGTPYGRLHETECKQQFSLAYAHAVTSMARCTMENIRVDVERVDFVVRQVAGHDQYDDAQVQVQMKCTSQDVMKADGVHWSLDLAHYDSLRAERTYVPKILVVLIVPTKFQQWMDHTHERAILRQGAYWASLRGAPEIDTDTKTVTLPKGNTFDVPGLLSMLKRIGDGGYP